MKPERLSEIKALREAVTATPWTPITDKWLEPSLVKSAAGFTLASAYREPDLEFIAQSPQIVDELVAEVEKLRLACDSSRNLYETCMDEIHRRAGVRRNGLVGIISWIDHMKEADD